MFDSTIHFKRFSEYRRFFTRFKMFGKWKITGHESSNKGREWNVYFALADCSWPIMSNKYIIYNFRAEIQRTGSRCEVTVVSLTKSLAVAKRLQLHDAWCRKFCYAITQSLKVIRIYTIEWGALKFLLIYKVAAVHLRPLQSALNAAARLIVRKQKYEHITATLRDDLHRLPVHRRIEYK